MTALSEDTKNMLRDRIGAKTIDKFGDPFDETDPRNTQPTERSVKFPNLSIEDRVRMLEADTELLMSIVAQLQLTMIKAAMLAGPNEQRSGGYL